MMRAIKRWLRAIRENFKQNPVAAPPANQPGQAPPRRNPPPVVVQPPAQTPAPSAAGKASTVPPQSIYGPTLRHQYSSVGAWNSDESMLMLLNRDQPRGTVFVDASLALLPHKPAFGYQEARWHPTDPQLMIYAGSGEVGTWNVVTGARTVIALFSEPQQQFGPWSGNVSDDGVWCVVSCGDPPTALYVLNLQTGEKTPISHNFAKVDYATISPSGRYFVVVGEITSGQYDRKRVYDRATQAVVQTWTEYGRPSHFDITVDEAGKEVAVGVSKSAPDDGSVIKRRLDTGEVTVLTTFGYAQHTSARCYRKPGHVVADFYGGTRWGPYDHHVVLIDINRPGQVVDLGDTKAQLSSYWAEPQPCISPSGSKVIYASNQGGSEIRPYIVTTGL